MTHLWRFGYTCATEVRHVPLAGSPDLAAFFAVHSRAPAELVFACDLWCDDWECNFEVLSRQVSLLHFTDDLRIPLQSARFYAVGQEEELLSTKSARPHAPPPEGPAPLPTGLRLRIQRQDASS